MDRRLWLVAGLLASVAITAVLWAVGIPGFFLFLALPFLFFPMSRGKRRTDPVAQQACPACGTPRGVGHRFCPACGHAYG